MTIQEFLDWIYKTYELKNPYDAVKKATELLKVTEMSIYHWKNGKRKLQPYMQQLIILTIENHDLKKKLSEK
ncbi:hypothetical protein CXU19_13365 [Akkermansia muciniphila]|jgi:hypothetical protein|nr:hypothetical protein CXU19_13365 [Akkermansia muciniphila]PNC38883.1 hypothetical protein CXU20_10390 [Akkermansia muciniphila]